MQQYRAVGCDAIELHEIKPSGKIVSYDAKCHAAAGLHLHITRCNAAVIFDMTKSDYIERQHLIQYDIIQ
jgi:hypothetical protein